MTRWEKIRQFWSREIWIEYKACLYFFAILVFYCTYRILQGQYDAGILHMTEQIFTTYGMGYLQLYLLPNFDEADHMGIREYASLFFCTGLYTGLSFLFGWFDQSPAATALFAVYMIIACVCAGIINKIRRIEDTKQLNLLLEQYQEGETDESN